jgi:hypothetical protein
MVHQSASIAIAHGFAIHTIVVTDSPVKQCVRDREESKRKRDDPAGLSDHACLRRPRPDGLLLRTDRAADARLAGEHLQKFPIVNRCECSVRF